MWLITIVGFLYFISVSSLKVFGHSIHSERRRIYIGKSMQALQNDTIIISWLFSFRVIQPTVQWHAYLQNFYVCFINSCSSQNLLRQSVIKVPNQYRTYMISVTRYKLKLSHGLTCHFMLDRLHWCVKQRNRTSVLLGELWSPLSINLRFSL